MFQNVQKNIQNDSKMIPKCSKVVPIVSKMFRNRSKNIPKVSKKHIKNACSKSTSQTCSNISKTKTKNNFKIISLFQKIHVFKKASKSMLLYMFVS